LDKHEKVAASDPYRDSGCWAFFKAIPKQGVH